VSKIEEEFDKWMDNSDDNEEYSEEVDI